MVNTWLYCWPNDRKSASGSDPDVPSGGTLCFLMLARRLSARMGG